MSRKFRRLGFIAACALAGIAWTAPAYGALVDVDFSPGNSGPAQSDAAVFGAPGDIWNNLTNSGGTAVGLNDVTGASSGLTLTWVATSGGFNAAGSPMDAATTNLMEDFLRYNGSALTIGGLKPSTAYQICLFGAGDQQTLTNGGGTGGQGTKFTIPQTGPSVVGTTTEVTPGSPLVGDRKISDGAGVAYVVLTANSDATGSMVVNVAFNSTSFSTGPVNGFQIQAVPEPASLGVLGFGICGLLARRRRS